MAKKNPIVECVNATENRIRLGGEKNPIMAYSIAIVTTVRYSPCIAPDPNSIHMVTTNQTAGTKIHHIERTVD